MIKHTLTRQAVGRKTGASRTHVLNWARRMRDTDLVSDDGQRFTNDLSTLVAARMGKPGPLPKNFPTPERIAELFRLWHKYEHRHTVDEIVFGVAGDTGDDEVAGAVWVELREIGLIGSE